jgi:glutamate-1-semialdehyde 2,1-aminomutase
LCGALEIMASTDQSLESALQTAIEKFIGDNPESEKVFNNASQHLPAGNTRTTLFAPPFPPAIIRAHGCKVVSADNKEYLDMVGEYTAGIYGHSHPQIIEALQKGLSNGVNFGATSPLEGELAARIKERFGPSAGLEMLRFTNSGTEANVLALATARVWTGRKKVLAFTKSYHGSVVSFKAKEDVEPMNIPGEYLVADYNSVDSVEGILSQIPLNSLAAVLIEPMQGAGGCFPASQKFLQYLRSKTTEIGALLIFDEVMTSRLHYEGGLSGKYGIKPDLITMGKYLGGGMSFGLFGGRRDIMSLFDPRTGGYLPSSVDNQQRMMLTHSGTFNNNLMTMHAGIAGSKILTREVLGGLNSLGDYMRHAISENLARRGIIAAVAEDQYFDIDKVPRGPMWVSGMGSMNVIHFGPNDEDGVLRDLCYFHMLEHGIYLTRRGFIVLSVQHSKEDVDQFLECVDEFLTKWETYLARK